MKLIQCVSLAAALVLGLALARSAQAQTVSCQVDSDCYQPGATGPAQFCTQNHTCAAIDSGTDTYCGTQWADINETAGRTVSCPAGFTAIGPGCPKNNPFTDMLPVWASIYCCQNQTASQVCASVACGQTTNGCGGTVTCPGTCAAGKSCIENRCSDAEIRNGRVVPALPPLGVMGLGLGLVGVAVFSSRKRSRR